MNQAILTSSVIVGIVVMLSMSMMPADAGISSEIDIKPHSINPDSRAIIPVVVFGDQFANIGDVFANSVKLSGATIIHPNGHLADFNGDGFTDFLGHYRTLETGIQAGDTQACISGLLNDGSPIFGCDAIVTNPR